MPERAIVHAVNVERAAHGLPGVRAIRGLSRLAERHSRDQLRHGLVGHDSSDGTPFARRIARVGSFAAAGEVVAFAPRGSASRARDVVRMWMRSSPHRAQLLNPAYRVVGVGQARGGLGSRSGAMVTADFARR